jgi:uncharacterized protein
MRFRSGASLDSSQVSDRRGMRAGPVALGGTGLLGLLVVLALQFFGGTDGATTGGFLTGSDPFGAPRSQVSGATDECRTGADAAARQDCRIVAVVNSVQEYWAGAVSGYEEAPTVLFSGQVSTACGAATSAVGPFYCPADATIYIDLSFYTDLERRFGARGGPFAEAYVVAHEYGHHVQHLLGADQQLGPDREGPQSGAVRLELQADCYAGVWAAHAERTSLIEDLSEDDIAVGLDAASVIGDDHIQETFGGGVNPETWTHGSSEQRQRWFSEGYHSGDPQRCDTFGVPSI